MGPESYRIRRNNVKIRAITPFKVIQGHRKPIYGFLLVNNTNFLPPILHRFWDMADYYLSNASAALDRL